MIQRKKKKGFTLVEMLVVIAIIAVLVGITTPIVTREVTKARAATNAANLRAAKGAFATMLQTNPDDMAKWSIGTASMAGQKADEEGNYFIIKGTATAPELTTTAPDAVYMKDNDVVVEEGTAMGVTVTNGGTNIRVTYNGLPIAYFAEVAKNGTAKPGDYTTSADITADYMNNTKNDLLSRYEGLLNDLKSEMGTYTYNDGSFWNPDYKEASRFDRLFGDTFTNINNQLANIDSGGDCAECIMASVQLDGGINDVINGLEKINMGGLVESILPIPIPDGETHICYGYQKDASKTDGSCICGDGHGPHAHMSTQTDEFETNAMAQKCDNGGVHSYDINHKCSKCGDQQPAGHHFVALPGGFNMLSESCELCGVCKCCYMDTFQSVDSDGIKTALWLLSGIDAVSDVNAIVNSNLCLSSNGCMHHADAHGIYN